MCEKGKRLPSSYPKAAGGISPVPSIENAAADPRACRPRQKRPNSPPRDAVSCSAVLSFKVSVQRRIPGGIPTRQTRAGDRSAHIQTGRPSTGGADSGSHRPCEAGARRPAPEESAAPRTRGGRDDAPTTSAGRPEYPPALPYSGHRSETASPCRKRSGPAGSGTRKKWGAICRATP